MKDLVIGDTVTIKDGLKEDDLGIRQDTYKNHYASHKTTITFIGECGSNVYYKLNIDGSLYMWKREWLEHEEDVE